MKPPTTSGADDVLTPAETAAWLKIERRQLERFGVPCVRLGRKTIRFLRGDVERWLQAQRGPMQRGSPNTNPIPGGSPAGGSDTTHAAPGLVSGRRPRRGAA